MLQQQCQTKLIFTNVIFMFVNVLLNYFLKINHVAYLVGKIIFSAREEFQNILENIPYESSHEAWTTVMFIWGNRSENETISGASELVLGL